MDERLEILITRLSQITGFKALSVQKGAACVEFKGILGTVIVIEIKAEGEGFRLTVDEREKRKR
jgi:hypothetical protein